MSARMKTACGFEPGVLHDHGAHQCHEASYRAGAVDALRAAADAIERTPAEQWGVSLGFGSSLRENEERGFYNGANTAIEFATGTLRARADHIARGESEVTS